MDVFFIPSGSIVGTTLVADVTYPCTALRCASLPDEQRTIHIFSLIYCEEAFNSCKCVVACTSGKIIATEIAENYWIHLLDQTSNDEG